MSAPPRVILFLSLTLFLWNLPSGASLFGGSSKDKKQQEQTTQSGSSSSPPPDPYVVRRERNLDHWDVDTLAAYLGWNQTSQTQEEDSYVGTDAAVMFYASWCPNCHSLAPLWDHLATHVQAGTRDSNFIMALFNCELSTQHAQLCSAVGVKHYPTLLFIGSGPYHDTDPLTSLGRKDGGLYAGKAKLARTVKFQGNWQYLDALLDWIRAMQFLSSWHEWNYGSQRPLGPLQWIRQGGVLGSLWPFSKSKQDKKTMDRALPIGVPPSVMATTAASEGGTNAAMSTAELTKLRNRVEDAEQEVEKLEHKKELLDKLAMHSALTVDSMLFPLSSTSMLGRWGLEPEQISQLNDTSDAFSVLDALGGWDNVTNSSTLFGSVDKESVTNATMLRLCVLEKSLDYCTRVSTHKAADWLDLQKEQQSAATTVPSVEELTEILQEEIAASEPYCRALDQCIKTSFADRDTCCPLSCPFSNPTACIYVSTCLETYARDEYEQALGIKSPSPSKKTSSANSLLESLEELWSSTNTQHAATTGTNKQEEDSETRNDVGGGARPSGWGMA